MSPDPFASLSAIRRFLRYDVLPEVPAALVGELRAAIKILAAVSDELEALHPRIAGECHDLQRLCHELTSALGEPEQATNLLADNAPDAAGVESTTALLRCHASLSELTASLIGRAQLLCAELAESERAALDELLHRCYATLGRHAASASRWQNVFEPVSERPIPVNEPADPGQPG